MSEFGKRWYGLSSGGQTQKSAAGDTVPQSGHGKGESHAHNWESAVEVGAPEFELPMYGRSRQTSDDRVRLNEPNIRQLQAHWQ